MPINFAFPDSLIFWTAGRVSVRINSGLGANSKSWTCKLKHKYKQNWYWNETVSFETLVLIYRKNCDYTGKGANLSNSGSQF